MPPIPLASGGFPYVPPPVMPQQSLPSFVPLGRDTADAFAVLLQELAAQGDDAFFHPHGFDGDSARRVVAASEAGPDEYWLLAVDEVVAYGMLRGWAEGYAVPSLGIAVGPRYRGQGHARAMMEHLHRRARLRGAERVRLKVDCRNTVARRLYESLGYVFQEHSPAELLGFVTLGGRVTAA